MTKSFLLCLLILVGCASSKPKPDPISDNPLFLYKEHCFILMNLRTRTFEKIHNVVACHERQPAASTFKIALAVMAFDSRVLGNETSSRSWDKVERKIPEWNKDHTAATWMRDSVVWYSQRLTGTMGVPRVKTYLRKFNYGNQSLASGLNYAWLTNAPFAPKLKDASLKISAFEQSYFLAELWQDKLPASKRAQALTRKIIVSESSPKGNVLSGKTGSAFLGKDYDLRLGWYVGHLKTKENEYIVVSNFVDKQKVPGERGFGGKDAKEMAKIQLGTLSLW